MRLALYMDTISYFLLSFLGAILGFTVVALAVLSTRCGGHPVPPLKEDEPVEAVMCDNICHKTGGRMKSTMTMKSVDFDNTYSLCVCE
jgi:hypothetical protein